jgi:hypothetical protein
MRWYTYIRVVIECRMVNIYTAASLERRHEKPLAVCSCILHERLSILGGIAFMKIGSVKATFRGPKYARASSYLPCNDLADVKEDCQ